MIVVFVVDTSPSMAKPLKRDTEGPGGSGMSRLDLAKMAVESLSKGLTRRVIEHNVSLQQETTATQKSLHNLGLGFCVPDRFLLLSTGRQYTGISATAACGAGGRLLVGYGDPEDSSAEHANDATPRRRNYDIFERELKHLQSTVWNSSTDAAGAQPQSAFPEDGGGANGLNIALSTGLQLLSRYRLNNRSTENFGLGRLPSQAMLAPSGGGAAVNALQPACLVLITDGECLRRPASEGGGSLQLQVGNMPLREFYQEPFRWDQRVFCLGVGGSAEIPSSQYLHPSLRALCEVTGGCHMMLHSTAPLSHLSETLLKILAPPRPFDLPLPDPLAMNSPPVSAESLPWIPQGCFINGGPVCCFQALEGGPNGEQSPTQRAMLLNVPVLSAQYELAPASSDSRAPVQPPMWCIPESFFPSKKFDVLPPRLAQPLLTFSRNFSMIGSRTFDPIHIMGLLQRLDQLIIANKRMHTGASNQHSPLKLLHRDVYICEWLSQDGRTGGKPPQVTRGMEYFPVCVRGAGRTLSEGDESFLSIGILHVPSKVSSLANSNSESRLSTLTLLPPEPHILLPLLLKAAEVEHRTLKKASEEKRPSDRGGATAGLIQKQSSSSGSAARPVHLDEKWRSDFRAYMFRIPPYYHNALKRSLRPILPATTHTMLCADGIESLAAQCFSKVCLQKIRNGEQVARDTNERLERQESELRRHGMHHLPDAGKPGVQLTRYGQYDPKAPMASFLACLRTMPAPWRVGAVPHKREIESAKAEASSQVSSQEGTNEGISEASAKGDSTETVVDILGDLPAKCLMAYYESRRRWVFGGSGLTTRGIQVEGTSNDGSNAHFHRGHHSINNESLLAIAGVGVSTLNQTTTVKMGDFRERLLWSRAPVVGYGSNDATGVAATTAPDGSARWSVDDDVLPQAFFDPKTGEFEDSIQTRVRSRLMVNFGNPYKDKRGDSLIPEKYLNQSPSVRQNEKNDAKTPPGSPPHDSFSAVEGEGEAVFAEQSTIKPVEHHVKAPAGNVDAKGKRPREPTLSGAATSKTEDTPRKKQKGHGPPPPSAKPPPPPPKPTHKKQPPPPPPPSRRPPPPRPPPEKRPSTDTSASNAKANPSVPVAPRKNVQPSGTPETKVQVVPQPVHSDLQSQDKKPNVDLPQGWMCVWSRSQRRWYFFNTKSNKSVWEWPPPGGGT